MNDLNIKIRRATTDDKEWLKSQLKQSWYIHQEHEPEFINRQVIEETNLTDYLSGCFEQGGDCLVLVAELEGKLAGACKLEVREIEGFFNSTTVLYVDDVVVAPDYQRRGVACSLLEKTETIAKQKGISWLKARIYAFNNPAQNLFTDAGYKKLYSEYFKILNE